MVPFASLRMTSSRPAYLKASMPVPFRRVNLFALPAQGLVAGL
jgi:hypothetical protein